ncbi:MAG: hypothetical protein IT379_36700 [Deltaproteobacteria bacterium]|nr:hypothetical protein [Deltaproteobacteria bacterium]
MRSWTEASYRLADSVRWLSRASAARLLLVQTNAAWRKPALDVIALGEHEEDNLRPFVWLESPWTKTGGWDERIAELQEETEALRTALREAELELLPLRSEDAPRRSDAERFARALYRLSAAIPEPLESLVVVVAPLVRDDDPGVLAALRSLVLHERTKPIRWALIDERDDAALAALAKDLGEQALVVRAQPDPAQLDRDVNDTLSAVAAGSGAAGATWSPLRIPVWDDPEQPTGLVEEPPVATQAPRAAPDLAPLGPTLHERLQRLIAQAVLAMRENRSLDAIRLHREARDLMFLHGSASDGIRMELLLASVMIGAGFRREARDLLVLSSERAKEAELPALLAQVELCRGGVLLALKEDASAAAVLATAGRAAEDAGERGMALEAYRLSGEAAVRAGLVEQAVEAWQRAVIVSGDDPGQPTTETHDAAAMAARLAQSCAKQGLTAQADSLNAQAQILAGFAAPPPAAAPSAEPAAAPDVSAETPGPATPAFREVRPEDLPRNKVAPELRGTVRIDDEPPENRSAPAPKDSSAVDTTARPSGGR